MEAWEEVSDPGSCRSSVISDLDELEANLYSYLHHERNDIFEDDQWNDCYVLPMEREVQEPLENFRSVIHYNLSVEKEVEFPEEATEGNNHSLEAQKEDINDHNKANKDSRQPCKQDETVEFSNSFNVGEEKESPSYLTVETDAIEFHKKSNLHHSKDCEQYSSNEIYDLRYNVDKDKQSSSHLTEGVVPSSPAMYTSKTVPDSKYTQGIKSNSPPVIDVLSSSDEDANEDVIVIDPPPKLTSVEEIVVEDSDTDIRIEMENVKKPKKCKKKKDRVITADLELRNRVVSRDYTRMKLNTVKSPLFEKNFPSTNSIESMMSYLQEDTLTSENLAEYRASLCKNWTPQMIHFYEDSWGGECLSISEIQRSMSDRGWDLDVSDEFYALPGSARDRRYFGNKPKGWCHRCCQKGHFAYECTEKIRPPCCHRCGSSNHHESRCQNKVCLTCGQNTNVLITACKPCRLLKEGGNRCTLCNQRGHRPNTCPDIWRRFHATVAPGKLVAKRVYKNRNNMYCCNCATKGHHAYQCKKRTYNDYVTATPRVISYQDPIYLKHVIARSTPTCSENWENVGIVAPNRENYHTPNRKELVNEKRGTKRARSPDDHGSFESKLTKHTDKLWVKEVANCGIENLTIKVNLPKANEPKKPKKSKLKPPDIISINNLDDVNELESTDLNVTEECNATERFNELELTNLKVTKECKTKGRFNQLESTDLKLAKECKTKGKFLTIGNLPKHVIPVERKLALTRKQKKRLATKVEPILKYIVDELHGIVAVFKQDNMLFIGTKKKTFRARKLLFSIIGNNEGWKNFTEYLKEDGIHYMNSGQTEKSEKKFKSKKEELRVEVKNESSGNTRNVKYLNKFGPNEHTQTFKDINEPKKDKLISGHSQVKSSNNYDIELVKRTIQGTAKTFLSEKEISREKLKLFADWALSMYGTVVNGLVKYHLKVLTTVNQNSKPLEFFRKHLLTIANWHNIPMVGKT